MRLWRLIVSLEFNAKARRVRDGYSRMSSILNGNVPSIVFVLMPVDWSPGHRLSLIYVFFYIYIG